MSFTVQVTKNILPRLRAQVGTRAETYSRESAEAVLADATSTVHVITGETRDSGHIEQRDAGYAVVFGGGGLWEEYGNRNRPPHPFLRPAAERQRQRYINAFKGLFD